MEDLPFEIDSKYHISHILKARHKIPYLSRRFRWERETYIRPVILDILKHYRSNKKQWLGIFIIYKNKYALPAVTDAQHRLTLCFLIILAIGDILGDKRPLNRISQYGDDDLYDVEIPPADKDILDANGWTRFPNIHSVYDSDFIALGNVLNAIHVEDRSDSLIYDAYDTVKEVILGEVTERDDQIRMLRFIENDVMITRMVITDWDFANDSFRTLNNIGIPVSPVNLLKNALVSRIGEARSKEIHDVFEEWSSRVGEGFDEFIHTVVNVFTRRITTKASDYETAVPQIFDLAEYQGCPLAAFRASVEKTLAATAFVNTDRFGILMRKMATGHEIMDFCILPLLVSAPSFEAVRPLFRRLVAFGIRNDKLNFNALKYQKPLIDLINQLLAGTMTFAGSLAEIDGLLRKWLVDKPAHVVLRRLALTSYKSDSVLSRIRCALFYLVETQDHHEASLDPESVDLEHIFPKTPAKNSVKKLEDPELCHALGNFTLFMGPNSKSGLKGNRSLSNRDYVEKAPQYKNSNIAMTRLIAARYEDFLDAQIQERTPELAALIEAQTTADLAAV